MRKRLGRLFWVLVLFVPLACGLEGSLSNTQISNLASLPSANVNDYVSSAGSSRGSASQSLSLSKSISAAKALVGTVGTFSRAGCECRQIRNELVTQGRQIDLNNCYLQAIGLAKDLDILRNRFAYYQVVLPGGEVLRVRLRNLTSEGTTTFQMDLCEPQPLVQTQVMSFDLTKNDGSFSGSIVNKYLEAGETIPDQSYFGFNITHYSESNGDFDFGSAEFSSQFDTRFGAGESTLTADKASALNQIRGSFKNGVASNDFTARLVCQFDNADGAAKFDAAGTIPPFPASDLGLSESVLAELNYSQDTALCPQPRF